MSSETIPGPRQMPRSVFFPKFCVQVLINLPMTIDRFINFCKCSQLNTDAINRQKHSAYRSRTMSRSNTQKTGRDILYSDPLLHLFGLATCASSPHPQPTCWDHSGLLVTLLFERYSRPVLPPRLNSDRFVNLRTARRSLKQGKREGGRGKEKKKSATKEDENQ